jgi:hypothetical protein
MFRTSLAHQLDRPAIELGTAEADVWRLAADRLYERWPAENAEIEALGHLEDSDIDVLPVVDAFLSEIAARPPALPCHGVTHTVRVLSHAGRIAERDRLDRRDTARLLLASAGHDVGRLLLHRDGLLRHADVSAILFESLRPDMGIPDDITIPARQAILMHSARRDDHLPVRPRVIDDVRSADKLDALDEIGFMRAVLFTGPDENVSIRPIVSEYSGRAVLYGWWKNVIRVEPVLVSPRERRLIARARERSRVIGNSISSYSGPIDEMGQRFIEAVRIVEPDANREAVAATLGRLEALSNRERKIWSGLFAAIITAVGRLEARRIADLEDLTEGRDDLAALARLLLAWSEHIEKAGLDLAA